MCPRDSGNSYSENSHAARKYTRRLPLVRGIGPYSAGVGAAEGFTIEHARLSTPIALGAGFDLVDAHLREIGRPRAALCAMALRSPAPFSFPGFDEFNAGYVERLKIWDLLLDGVNPIARTNVAPEVNPPAEPSLYSFAYTVPVAATAGAAPRDFVVAGAGELPEGSLDPGDVVGGELAAKARFVLALMHARLDSLGASWAGVTVTNVYTVHDVNTLLPEILPRIEPAARHGITWHYTRPPILSIEFEMDLRGCSRECVIPVT
jgi:hypothetical protein